MSPKKKLPDGRGAVRRPTMGDIAALAGLHPSSVSLALRDSPAISVETRARIRQIAQEIGYLRDPALDVFNFRRTSGHPMRSAPVLAFVSDEASWETFSSARARCELLEGIVAASQRVGFVLERFLVGPGRLSGPRLRQILRTRNTDSVVVGPLSMQTTVLPLDWERLGAVRIESFHLEPALDIFSSNYRQAALLAVEELYKLGYRRIGLALGAEADSRLAGLLHIGFLTGNASVGIVPPIPACFGEAQEVARWVERYDVEVVLGLDAGLAGRFTRHSGVVAFASLDLAGAPEGTAGVRHAHSEVGARVVESIAVRRYIYQRGVPERPTRTFVPVRWEAGHSAPARL